MEREVHIATCMVTTIQSLHTRLNLPFAIDTASMLLFELLFVATPLF